MRRTAAVVLLVIAALAMSSRARGADPAGIAEAEKASEAAARAWLALVDAGKYGESWDAAAALFKAAVTRDQWIQALDKVRQPLGAVSSRKLLRTGYLTEVPNAPKGEYVLVVYSTDFREKPGATETITPTKDPDGIWRVSGYYIR